MCNAGIFSGHAMQEKTILAIDFYASHLVTLICEDPGVTLQVYLKRATCHLRLWGISV